MFQLLTSLKLLLICTGLFMASVTNATTSASDRKTIVMNETETKNWQAVNDNVMGGVSKGGMAHNENYGLFSGTISKENNGGFSSVLRPSPVLDKHTRQVQLKVQGDGKTYQFRLVQFIGGYRISYKHEFITTKNIIQTVSLPIADFVASYHGRIISNAPKLAPENVRQLSFLHANKNPEPFALKVFEIEFH